ncbi:kinase-like domain-containing protein [Rhizophagus clarus]|uniref:Kinase-like domain-containing protein n=1 Tax=Rhizophagus clarus TaxID=94130 RepID=A0A8H3MC33_9GLOM|nr:kinase-like domain-containing protein [Rhizophagus clarus]
MPKTVWGPSAVFTDSKIYITGGLNPKLPDDFTGLIFSNEFYYLDVKQPFVVKVGEPLRWVELSSQDLPDHAWSAFSTCGLDDSLILYIGENDTSIPTNFVYIYGISSQQWDKHTTTNPPLSYFHSQTQTVCDINTRKMYRYGGILPLQDGTNNYNHNLDILDTSTLVWETIIAPEQRYDHTGTLLQNGYIVYIGGTLHNGDLADISQLSLYDTNNNTWSSMYAGGYSPAHRSCHSAVLTQDGRIIVYGGCDTNINAVLDDLVILDTSQIVYTWSKANVTNVTDPPNPRCYHKSILVGDYMIVLFGRDNIQLSNETFILDTSDKSNYKWVSEFDPNPKPDLNKNSSTQKRNLIIGIIISSIVLALIGASFLIYLYRKRKLSKQNIFTDKTLCGVLPFIASEVLLDREFTKAADIYGIGMLIAEVICGEPLFVDGNYDGNFALVIYFGQCLQIPEQYAVLMRCSLDSIPTSHPTAMELDKQLYELYCTLGVSKYSKLTEDSQLEIKKHLARKEKTSGKHN